MSDAVQRVRDALEEIGRLEDPAEQAKALTAVLAAWPDLHALVRAQRQDAIVRWHGAGASYQAIGHQLGMSRERAWQIAHGVTKPLRADDDG